MGEFEEHMWIFQLPYEILTLCTLAECIKYAISGFDDAYVSLFFLSQISCSSPPSRKSDIENERLPPELFDAEETDAFLAQHAHLQSLPEVPSPGDLALSTSGSIEASIEVALSSASLASS